MAKHFVIDIGENHFGDRHNQDLMSLSPPWEVPKAVHQRRCQPAGQRRDRRSLQGPRLTDRAFRALSDNRATATSYRSRIRKA